MNLKQFPRRQWQIHVDTVYKEWFLPFCKILTEKQIKVHPNVMVDQFANQHL